MRPHPIDLPDRLGDLSRKRTWARGVIGHAGWYQMRWRFGDKVVGAAFEFLECYDRRTIARLLMSHRDQMRATINHETKGSQ